MSLARMVTLALLIMAGPLSAAALPADLKQALDRLAAAPGFTARFEQVIRFSDGSEQRYRGEVAVERPGRFRWRYETPYEQLYVSDGQRIWHYEPDLMQVQVLRSLQGVDPTVMKLLDGRAGVRDIAVLESARDADGTRRYHARLGSRTVWLGLRDGRLAWIESVDALGNRNRIRLLDVKLGAPPDRLFAFTPPKGVEVLPLQ